LFFILSGFLIHLKYDYKSILNWSDFYYKRFWRIVPIYWVVLLLFFFFYITESEQKIYDLFLHFFFLHNLDSETFYSIDPSFWSLAVEVQFYLLFPVLVTLYRKFGIIKISFFFLLISMLIQFIPVLDKTSILSTFKFLYIWLFGGLTAIYRDKIKIRFVSTIQLVILSGLTILHAAYSLFFWRIQVINATCPLLLIVCKNT
jgi:peptidoglycan/LPS O-acetylase OafA/YrhL